jgi:hypothetical protein
MFVLYSFVIFKTDRENQYFKYFYWLFLQLYL